MTQDNFISKSTNKIVNMKDLKTFYLQKNKKEIPNYAINM